MESLLGKVLFAAPTLLDPHFARTAILLVQHVVMKPPMDAEGDAEEETALWTPDDTGVPGAMGLVLNRGSGAKVADVLAEATELNDDDLCCKVNAELFHGGPCDGPLMVLHGGKLQENATPVMAGVTFSSDGDAIRPVLAGNIEPARFFAGYAGWGPGQLETELDEGAWVVGELSATALLNPLADPWQQLLGGSLAKAMLKGANPAILPRDPSLN
ncbi:MAG: YqgE/AlgH family protein [Algisphaera sp.]